MNASSAYLEIGEDTGRNTTSDGYSGIRDRKRIGSSVRMDIE